MLKRSATIGLTAAVGVTGGFLLSASGIPGGWIVGAILASFLAGMLKMPLYVPKTVRSFAMGFAGLTIGSAVDRELLLSAALLPWTLCAMFGLIALLTCLVYALHRRYWQASPATAISCAWPGNVLQAFAGAQSIGADMERVTVVQLVRVVILMGVLPLTVGALNDADETAAVHLVSDFWLASGLAILCTLAAMRLRIIGGEMFFSAALIGALSGAELLTFRVPDSALAALQVVVGVYIGLSLAGCRREAVVSAMMPALAGAFLAAALTLIGAYALEDVLHYPPATLALAFAPGGAEAMILLSATLGADPAFVGIHHTVRLILMTVLFPAILRHFARRYQATGKR